VLAPVSDSHSRPVSETELRD
jgi:hypothetical protein